MMERNDPCWCGSGQKWKKCHWPTADKVDLKKLYQKQYGILIKSKEEIEGIRTAGHLAAMILDKVCAAAKQGVTTEELDAYAVELHKKHGAIAAPLGYGDPPFPKSICTSLNEVICHGIPDQRPLQEGDILNIDVTVILNGFYGDCSKMVAIGKISKEKQTVFSTAHECLMRSISLVKPGLLLHKIGDVIEEYAQSQGCSVVNQFVGHGTGVLFHEAPQVPHHKNHLQIPLAPGMTFTIEPMINFGRREAVIDEEDAWTARTIDLLPSAQWEHTLLVTETGHEILTPWTL